jgi:hypothetical protein
MTWGKVYWPTYLILLATLFAIPELIALATNYANTLSDYAHLELNVTTATVARGIHTVAWYVSLVGWLVFVVIITWHIWWAGP